MSFGLLLFFWILNCLISVWNSYATGKVWVPAKSAGGWPRFMAWMGYLMASVGFSWCFFVLFGQVLLAMGKINGDQAELLYQIAYVVLVPCILFSGYAIMFQSWANAYHRRTLGSAGVAAYNTYANMHNTFNAIDNFPKAFGKVFEAFTRGGGKSKGNGFILFVALVCILAGFILAAVIVWRVAASEEKLEGKPAPA